jgi:hypothetical protein
MANQGQPTTAPPPVTLAVTMATTKEASTNTNPANVTAGPVSMAPVVPGDKTGTGDKSKAVSSLVLEEIKKIQKATDKHRVGGKGGGATFR